MKTANDIVLKALGALLIVAGALKGWQLLTVPIANNSIWTWRPFMVLQVDFELALSENAHASFYQSLKPYSISLSEEVRCCTELIPSAYLSCR